MDNFERINPTFVEHEGFYYLTFEGEYFKGCKRCGGEGQYSFNGEHSRCYECDNTSAKLGAQLPSKEAAEKWCHERAVRRAQRERAAEAKRMLEVNTLAKKVAGVPEDVRTFLLAVELNEYDGEMDYYAGNRNPNYEKDSFIRNMAEQLQFVSNARRLFTDKMIEAVRSNMASRAERAVEAATAPPAPAGRVVVAGEIVSTKIVEGDYGTAYKILIKTDEGFKVWASLPKAQAEEAADTFFEQVQADGYSPRDFGFSCWFEGTQDGKYTGIKGKRIAFTATLEPSVQDASFAFGSRPTKGAWL